VGVGDLIVLNESSFERENIFGYKRGDIGLIKKIVYNKSKEYKVFLVILLKDFKEYHIPNDYLTKLEKKC
jgi:hypothetical protein